MPDPNLHVPDELVRRIEGHHFHRPWQDIALLLVRVGLCRLDEEDDADGEDTSVVLDGDETRVSVPVPAEVAEAVRRSAARP